MSARPVTVVVAVSLFGVVGSNVVVVAVAVLDRTVPLAVFAGTATVSVIAGAAVATGRLAARVQVTGDAALQTQPVPFAETKVVPAGIVSLTLIPVAAEPVEAVLLFVTVIV
jgi:hypothetical protein